MKIIFRIHAIQRMFVRGVTDADIRFVLENGEPIEYYPDDTLYPSRLVLDGVAPVRCTSLWRTSSKTANGSL